MRGVIRVVPSGAVHRFMLGARARSSFICGRSGLVIAGLFILGFIPILSHACGDRVCLSVDLTCSLTLPVSYHLLPMLECEHRLGVCPKHDTP